MTQLPTREIVSVEGLYALSLRGVNLTLSETDRVAIIGESGSGKSVLLGCILGLIRPSAGVIHVLGAAVRGKPLNRPGLGVAFQEPGLFDTISVSENLALASPRILTPSEIRLLLHRVGLAEIPPTNSVGNLSGGQQKRLSVLRAILRGERLLILDEPTSGLDSLSTGRICSVLNEELGIRPRGLLLITHDFEFALRLHCRIWLLAEGILVNVTPDVGASEKEAVRSLQGSISQRKEATPPAITKYAAFGLLPLLVDFGLVGLTLSIVLMGMLGFLLVIQTISSSPIDISRVVPAVVVSAVFRELGPLVVGMLLSGRIASRIAAQTGGMSYTAQLASMRVMGLSPIRRLLIPFMAASCLVFPICILAGSAAAVLGAAAISELHISGLHIGTSRFLAIALDHMSPRLPGSCAAKGIMMGLSVAVVAYLNGAVTVHSTTRLGRVVTLAIVETSVVVVIIDVVLSLIIF